MFRGLLVNVHGGAGTLSATCRPYALAAGAIAPFPAPVPAGYDLWILGASAQVTAGAPTTTKGAVSMFSTLQGFGVNDSGVAVVRDDILTILNWPQQAVTAGTLINLVDANGIAFQRPAGGAFRIPRQTAGAAGQVELYFTTTTDALATWELQLYLGMFPVGLGQDGIV